MKHYGDITKISGYSLPAVDVITGGSPCQDLSVAGKRAGLEGERSGLFMEQIRIVKEMRQHDRNNGRADELLRPRYMVWENVPGAFSSNGGKDFQSVLTEIVRIAESEAPDVPMPEKNKWPKSGCLYDDMGRWSIAWRVHDAQFWGVPQRRKRIALVADFGGLSAPEILFERKGLSGNFDTRCAERESSAGEIEGSLGDAVTLRIRGGCEGGGKGPLIQNERSGTLGCNQDQTVFCLNGQGGSEYQLSEVHNLKEPILIESNQNHATIQANGICTTLPVSMGIGGGYVPAIVMSGIEPTVFDARRNGDGQTVCTLTSDHQNRVTDYTALVSTYQNGTGLLMTRQAIGEYKELNAASSCCSRDYKDATDLVVNESKTVRRLTPMECERLQGFPDGWTDIGEWTDAKGKTHKEADSPRYKALGNSIALPFWQYLARRICAQYERPATMASLFDGIGGFPLVFEKCGAKAVWASEIEEFPIAVTKIRFPEKEA